MKASRLKSLFTGRKQARYRRRLKIEQLERRRLLATDISLSSGSLLIEDVGTAVNDRLTLRTTPNDFVISDAANTLTTSIAGASGSGTSAVTVPRTSVTGSQVMIQMQAGAL